MTRHSHAHHHAHSTGRALTWSLVATTLFVAIEVGAGIQARSLALLSDAGHNMTDALALLLALFGFYFAQKPANEVKTYGYHRAGVLAAFVNALVLLALSVYIFRESYQRLLNPQPVEEVTMLVVAGLGLLVNVGIMWALRGDKEHDLNVRAAFVHMLGDALGSVGIIIGAGVIRSTGWMAIDSILSIIIGALIVWSALDVTRESLNILLEGLPRGLTLPEVTDAIRAVDGVIAVHDLHVWSLGSSLHALSCHVRIDDMPPSASESILKQINGVLCDRFRIHHTTIQFEHTDCGRICSLPAQSRQHSH
jgi:cobalt-zinc-cadmium efflux system protein